jgi:hypothetical protein
MLRMFGLIVIGSFKSALFRLFLLFSLVEKIMQRLDEEELQLFLVVACQIWLRRNAIVFGGEFLSP